MLRIILAICCLSLAGLIPFVCGYSMALCPAMAGRESPLTKGFQGICFILIGLLVGIAIWCCTPPSNKS